MSAQPCILIVDDDAPCLISLSHQIATAGFEVRQANNGQMALAELDRGVPDLVLLDVRMPYLGGFEVLREIQSRDDCRELPVIMLSAFTEAQERATAIESGAADFLSKPTDKRELLARVRMQLELARLRVEQSRQAAALRLANEMLEREVCQRQRIEKALQTRMLALTRPLDSVDRISISDLFDLTNLQQLQDQFSAAAGVASVITLPDGTPITQPSNFCKLCDEVIRKTEIGCRNCYHSDAVLGFPCADGPTIRQCLSGGLWDAGAGITVGGKHIANWLIGQVRDEAQTVEELLPYADVIGADRDRFRDALAEVPVMSMERFERTAKALFVFAQELSSRAYQNVQQARFITESQQTEKALRESERNFRLLIDGMLDGFALHEIILDEAGQPVDYRFISVNPAFEQLTGLQAKDLINHTVLEVLPSTEPIWIERYGKVALTGESARFEERSAALGKDFKVTAFRPQLGQFAVVVEDITDRKLSEARIARLSQLYAALSHCNQAIVRSTSAEELLPTLCNDVVNHAGMSMAWVGLLDEPTGALLPVASAGTSYDFFENPSDPANPEHPSVNWPTDTALREKCPVWCHDCKCCRGSDSWHERRVSYGWVSCAALPLYRDSQIIGALSIFSDQPNAFDEEIRELLVEMADDISFALEGYRREEERRVAQATLVAATARAEDLAVKAEASSRTKSEFLAMMSHELRTPLNGVLGFAELLADSQLDPEQALFTQTIIASGDHLLAVVNDILDFSSIEKGTLAIEGAPFPLADLLGSAGIGSHPAAVDKGLDFRCEIAPGVPNQITGDQRRIRQILINLLNNAVKFTAAGSVTLRVAPVVDADCHFLDFAVTDTGIGISEATMERLFQPFVQADRSMNRKFGGTGLGLAISRRIAEAMGGSLTVMSQVGQGSTFTFRLPLQSQPQATPDTTAEVAPSSEPSASSGIRVLVVDDDRIGRKLAGIHTQNLGHQTEFATNGQEAVKAYAPGKFDVILMDIAMPVMDGLQATAKIRELEVGTGSHVPIIAVTANVMPGDRERFLACGMDEFLAKPFKRDALAAKLAPFILITTRSSGTAAPASA